MLSTYAPLHSIPNCDHHDLRIAVFRTSKSEALKSQPYLDFGRYQLQLHWIRDMSLNALADDYPERHTKTPHIPDILLQPPVSQQRTLPNSLDDDSLRAIFHHLDLTELCYIADTNTRFHYIAQQVFGSKYHNQIFKCISNQWLLWMFVQFFSTFGPKIVSIDLSACLFGAGVMLDLMKKYCTNLEEIRCSASDELFSFAPNLRKLHLFKQFYPNMRGIHRPSTEVINLLGLFPAHSQLQILTVENAGEATVVLPDIRLRHLRDLRLNGVRLANQPSTEQFFELNTQIETITFKAMPTSFRRNLKDVLKHSPSMRRLVLYCDLCDYLRMDNGLLRCFGFCRNLRALKIWTSTAMRDVDSRAYEKLSEAHWDPTQATMNDDSRDVGRHMLRIVNSIANLTEFLFSSKLLNFQQIRYFIERTDDQLTSIVLEIRRPLPTQACLARNAAVFGEIDEIVRKRGIRLLVVIRVKDYPTMHEGESVSFKSRKS